MTSDLFGLPTTLDTETQSKLDRKLQLQYKEERTGEENEELSRLTQELEQLGFSRTTRDPLYGQFLEHLYSRPEFQDKPITDDDRKKMTELMDDILEEILKEENKSEEAFMEHNIHPQQPSTKKGRYFQCRHKTLCAWRKWPRSWASPSPTPTR